MQPATKTEPTGVLSKLTRALAWETHGLPFWSLSWGLLRDVITCLSFANLCFVRVWEATLAYRRREVNLMREVPTAADFLAPIFAVILSALLLFMVVRLCRRHLPLPAFRVTRYLSLGLLILPLNGFRAVLARSNQYLKSPLLDLIGPHILYLVILPLFAIALWLLWKGQRVVVRIAIAVLVSLFPFCLFTFSQGISAALRFRPSAIDHPPAPLLTNPPTTARVLWVIFDEWDFRLTFKDRPAGLAMPAVEQFAAQSISGVNVRSPAMDTGTSVPTVLTGQRLRMAESREPTQFSAEEVEGLERIQWSRTPTIFSAAHQAGYNTAVIGWYLPYCRMFDFLNDCAWWPLPDQSTSTGNTFWTKVYADSRSLLETDTLSVFGQSLAVRRKIAVYRNFLARAEAAVSNPQMGFIFLHIPVPHAPHAYNRRTGKFDLKNSPVRGYVDSLALLDKTLATLRLDMEKAGLWDKTTVLLTADHPFRAARSLDGKSDLRIPYMLKMQGQTQPEVINRQFNSILTADLLLSILQGKVSTVPQAADWLRANARSAEMPVPVR